MNFDELLGPSILSEFPDLSPLGQDVASKLDDTMGYIEGIYRTDGLDIDEVLQQLKKAGYEEGHEPCGDNVMLVDEESLKVTKILYLR